MELFSLINWPLQKIILSYDIFLTICSPGDFWVKFSSNDCALMPCTRAHIKHSANIFAHAAMSMSIQCVSDVQVLDVSVTCMHEGSSY